MKADTIALYILTMLAALGLVVLGMSIQRHIQGTPAPVTAMPPDTTYIHDTTYIDKPVPKLVYTDRIVAEPIDSSDIAVRDDSLLVPIETKIYENDKFRAVVEGYRPRLMELELYTEHMQITKPMVIPTSRWSIGVTAGPVVTRDGIKPGISVGLTYNLKTFPTRGN